MKTPGLVTFLLIALPTLAHAHPDHGNASGFAHGFLHPVQGLDHILAMIAVGLWAAQMGGRAIWAVPVAFVGAMTLGAVLGIQGVNLPLIEPGILTSIIVLGLLIATACRLPLAASMPLVAVFAICHGFAHGAEMPLSASGFTYCLGFVLATTALHIAGVGIGIGIEKISTARWIRLAGPPIVALGVALAFN